jgi:hypothetical protein
MQEALPRLTLMISVVLCALLAGPPRAWAQSRTAPEATQHALDELTNAMAQGKITATPSPTGTPTLNPTATPVPAATSSPKPPTETPAPVGAPAEPTLPVPDPGRSVAAYVRPSPRDAGGTWLELAVPQGRWAILYDTTLCAPPAPWTNVWLTLDDQSDRPITADRDGDGAMCAVAASSWTSDVPCAADDQGTCDVALDGAYWEALGQAAPTATDTPQPLPTPEPQVRATAEPRVAAAAPPPATAAPRMQVVVQTVIVVVTAELPTQAPTQTRAPTSSPPPTPSARTPSPTSAPTATAQPTSTEAPVAAVYVAATQAPTPVAQVDAFSEGLSAWNWTLTFVILGVALALLAIWLFVMRSGPVMW